MFKCSNVIDSKCVPKNPLYLSTQKQFVEFNFSSFSMQLLWSFKCSGCIANGKMSRAENLVSTSNRCKQMAGPTRQQQQNKKERPFHISCEQRSIAFGLAGLRYVPPLQRDYFVELIVSLAVRNIRIHGSERN